MRIFLIDIFKELLFGIYNQIMLSHKMGFVDIVFQLDCQSIHSIFLKLFVHGLPTMNKQHRPFSQRAKL